LSISIRDRIFQWCQEEKVFKEEIKDEKATFHFRVAAPGKAIDKTDAAGLGVIDISQPVLEHDKIVVSGGIAFDPKFMARAKSISNADDVLFELNMALENRPESYFIDYGEGRVIKSIVVVEEIFFDGLTKDRLFRTLRGINKSLIISLWVLRPLIEALGGDAKKLIEVEEPAAQPVAEKVSAAVTATAPQAPSMKTEEEKPEVAKFCPKCGRLNAEGARFCPACGQSLLKG